MVDIDVSHVWIVPSDAFPRYQFYSLTSLVWFFFFSYLLEHWFFRVCSSISTLTTSYYQSVINHLFLRACRISCVLISSLHHGIFRYASNRLLGRWSRSSCVVPRKDKFLQNPFDIYTSGGSRIVTKEHAGMNKNLLFLSTFIVFYNDCRLSCLAIFHLRLMQYFIISNNSLPQCAAAPKSWKDSFTPSPCCLLPIDFFLQNMSLAVNRKNRAKPIFSYCGRVRK